MLKISSPLKKFGQMEPNLAGNIYVRSKPGIDGPWVCPFQNCFSIILLLGERYRLSGLSL
jgi:hypothetical protein